MTYRSKQKMIGWGILFGVLAICLLPLALLTLWNWLMPLIFGLPEITFLQALGLFILSKLLFSGFSGHGHSHRSWNGHLSHREHFKEKLEEDPHFSHVHD